MIENLRFNTVLLVLGNGFDLNCGCLSAYTDYFEYLEKTEFYCSVFKDYRDFLNETNAKLKDDLSKILVNGLNLYKEIPILIFYFYAELESETQKTGNWLDIEAELKDFLLNKLDKLVDIIDKDNPEESAYDSSDILVIMALAIKYRTMNFKSYHGLNMSTKEKLCDYLLRDLKKIESDFSSYLKQYNTNIFIKKRSELLTKIKNIFPSITEFKICSLNYTTIETDDDIINLHGTMSNPIIGIDLLPDDDPCLRGFTKSNRKISDEDIPSLSSILKEDKCALVFYGCSLCPTDKDELAAFRYFTRPDFQFYILYNEYNKDGALYNPRQSLVDNLQEYLLGSNGRDYGINNMASFDYSYQSGTINFINIDKI